MLPLRSTMGPVYSLFMAVGMLLQAMAPQFAVTVDRDVVYRRAEGYWQEAYEGRISPGDIIFQRSDYRRPLDLTLDIYRPEGDVAADGRPLMFMMHGGAYFIGGKAESGQSEWCRYFASLGYVAVSINYRMGYKLDKASILRAEDDAFEDSACALEYILGRDDLGIDRDRVYLAGTSAGASMALKLAYGAGPAQGCRVRAVGFLWGYIRDLSILGNACIPIISFQSEQDPAVPYRSGVPMKMSILSDEVYGTWAVNEKAAGLGIPTEHHPCPERRHRLHLDDKEGFTPRFYEIRDALESFFNRY